MGAFWISKKQKEEDSAVLSPLSQILANSTFEEAAKTTYETSNSADILGMNSEENTEKLIKKHGWWVSSRWAHLNEPSATTRRSSLQASLTLQTKPKLDNLLWRWTNATSL